MFKDVLIKLNFEKIKKDPYYLLAITLIIFTTVIGVLTRLFSVFFYTSFLGDQARDSFVYHYMSEGLIPGLGPGSSVGGYSLPPLYYYMVYLMSFFSKNPIAHASHNSIFSFLSIYLFGILLYQLFNTVEKSKRLLLSAFGMFWWSTLISDIIFANMQWNPNSIPFFLLSYILVQYKILQTDNKKTLTILFIVLGFVSAILSNLHSTTFFTIPIALLIFFVFYFHKHKNKQTLYYFGVTLLTILALHIPYFYWEFNNNFTNTTNLIKSVVTSDGTTKIFMNRVERFIYNYLNLGPTLLFPYGQYFANITNLFLVLSAYIGVSKFKGNKELATVYLIPVAVFYFISSNYWGLYLIHYQIPLWTVPIVLLLSTVIFSNYQKKLNLFVVIILSLVGLHSVYVNSVLAINYFNSTTGYGMPRIANTKDYKQAIQTIDSDMIVCTDPGLKVSMDYISSIELKRSNNFIDSNCVDDEKYYRLTSKNIITYDNGESFKSISRGDLNYLEDAVVFENEAVVLYKQTVK